MIKIDVLYSQVFLHPNRLQPFERITLQQQQHRITFLTVAWKTRSYHFMAIMMQ